MGKFLLLLCAFLLAACDADKAVTDSTGHFLIAAGMPAEQQKAMQADLDQLRSLEIAPEVSRDPFLTQVMEIPEVNSGTLFNWLSDRVHYIVGESLKLNDSTIVDLGPLPGSGLLEMQPSPNLVLKGADDLRVAMFNVGAAIYMTGKQYGSLIGLRVPGVENAVAIRSPRTGVIQVGEALFQLHTGGSGEADAYWRLGVFFHEARHSDGHGDTLDFTHVECPAGHQYEGAYACDDNVNGPYAIESRLLHVFNASCKTCNEKDKLVLLMQEADDLSRVVCEGGANCWWDPTPEGI